MFWSVEWDFLFPLSHPRATPGLLFVLKVLVQLVMVHLRTTNGSMAGGLHTRFLCQLLTRNLSLLFWQPHVLDHRCSRRRILFQVDNEAVVQTLNSRTFTDPNINHLLRSLLKVAVRLSYTFTALHVPRKNNGVADALSRFNWQGFRSQAPYATKSPVPISRHLVAQLSTVIYKLATFPS